MIASVRGTVIVSRPGEVVIESAGVGYRLAVSAETLAAVPEIGAEARLFTHLVVRDDAMSLYGFATEDERTLFLLLIGVQAVGPKVAQAALGGGPTGELLQAIAASDTARFQAVPGIGKRTAERIIVELREKVAEQFVVKASRAPSEPVDGTREALAGLGFDEREVEKMLAGASGDTVEEMLAEALKVDR